MTTQRSPLLWPEMPADTKSAQRDDLVQLGVWMFLATVVMLFAAFTSAYIVRRSASDWTPIELPGILWVNTAILVASSIALERGRRAASRRGKDVSARYTLSAAVGLGIMFLLGQVTAWRELVAQGVYLPTSPHSSFVYILTGVHGVHVAAGLVLLVYTTTRLWMVSAHLNRDATARLLTASATFWHFLAALWLYVFALVTVF